MTSRAVLPYLLLSVQGRHAFSLLLPFIAEITKYIIKLRVHKRRSIYVQRKAFHCCLSSSWPPQLCLSASEHDHTRIHVTVTSCSCLPAPLPLAFDWHSMQPVGALRAQAGKLAVFPLIAVGASYQVTRHSTLTLSFEAYLLAHDKVRGSLG